MTKVSDEQRKDILKAWTEERATGQVQQEFCSEKGISSRTLRAWVAAEGAPKVSVGQAEVILRRAARHLLEAAEELTDGTSQNEVSDLLAQPSERRVDIPDQPAPPVQPQEIAAEPSMEPVKKEKCVWNFD